MKPIDKTDIELLNILQENAHLTNKELANKLGLTITPVYERVKKMEKSGIIKKYVTLVDYKKLGQQIISYITISLRRHTLVEIESFITHINTLTEVTECYHISGKNDYLLKVIVKDMDEYQEFIIKKISALENIGHIESSFVLKELKHTTMLKLKDIE